MRLLGAASFVVDATQEHPVKAKNRYSHSLGQLVFKWQLACCNVEEGHDQSKNTTGPRFDVLFDCYKARKIIERTQGDEKQTAKTTESG